MFEKSTYINRRKKLMHVLRSGVLLFMGNEESPMNYTDNPYRFRQDSNFLYFFGISQPSLVGIIDIDEGREIIFGDELTMDMIVWMGNQPKLQNHAQEAGISDIRPSSQIGSYLSEALSKERNIHILPPYRPENKWKLNAWLGWTPGEIEKQVSVDFIRAVIAQREIKSEEEIVEIEKAVNTTVDMHIAGIQVARPGMLEAEVAAEVHKVALAANGDISFPIIATINGQTLHNHYHGNTIQEGDLFLLDAGAENPSGYAGDLSSTFPVSRKFTEQQKEIYALALKAHEAAIARLAPRVPFKEVHYTAARTIVEGLKSMSLMKGDTEEALAAGAHALFLPCGTGHMLGLDIHDMEDLGEVWVGYDGIPKSTQFGLKSLRLAKPLKPGFVFTIEPGIYFIPELIDLWKSEETNKAFLNFDKIEKFRNFGGIRNEENFLLTESGARVLGKRCPKTIEEVEVLRDY